MGRYTVGMAEQVIEIKRFDALSLVELHACLKLRGEVFVVGQRICAVPEVDEHDPFAYHVMCWAGNELIGAARLLGGDAGQVIQVGRVAVGQPHTRKGTGTRMMRAIQNWISGVEGRTGRMHAQAYLVPWYEKLGWRAVGERFVEAGIDHQTMLYDARPRVL